MHSIKTILHQIFRLLAITILIVNMIGCATVSTENAANETPQALLSKQDQKDFDHYMNVSNDGTTVNWRNEDESTSFQLKATHTHVNDRGLACRDFELVIDKDYHRKKVINATACRDNGVWLS